MNTYICMKFKNRIFIIELPDSMVNSSPFEKYQFARNKIRVGDEDMTMWEELRSNDGVIKINEDFYQ